jgi:hypothetical protein
MHTDGFHYFIPGVLDPDAHEAIRLAVPEASPLAVAFRSGGSVLIGKLVVPVAHVSLSQVQVLPAQLAYRNKLVVGVAIRLPDQLARLHAAWDAVSKGVEYDLTWLLKSYAADCGKEVGKLVENRVMRSLFDGLQGQASTDIRLPRNTVGMSRKTARLFFERLVKRHASFAALQDLDGVLILAQRFPVANPKGARWVKIIILPDVPDFQLLFNPIDWNDLNGGDTDGDQGFGSTDGKARIGKRLDVGPYPHLVRYDEAGYRGMLGRLAAGWTPTTPQAAVERVMSMCIKELVGSLDYTFHNLARAYAVSRASGIPDLTTRKREFRTAYLTIFGVYFPVQEKVMDARKLDGGLDALYRLAEVLECAVAGKAIDPAAFDPFLTDTQQGLFREILYLLNHTLGAVRTTAFGTLVAAGRKRSEKIGDLLSRLDLEDEDLLATLQDDAVGTALCELPPKRKSRKKKEQVAEVPRTAWIDPEVKPDPQVPGDSLLALFRSVKYGQHALFTHVRFDGEYAPQGFNRVVFFVNPCWLTTKGTSARHRVTLDFPAVFPVGKDGHCLVEFPGLEARFFRPRFRLVEGAAVKIGFGTLLKELLLQVANGLLQRRSLHAYKVQDAVERPFKRGLLGLQIRSLTDPEEGRDGCKLLPSSPRLDLIHRGEFEVETPGKSVVDRWLRRTVLLTLLAEAGYDVLSTSKGLPGTVVAKANRYGVPEYLHAINPYAVYLDGKRRVEPREIRRALPLTHPEPLKVQAQGTCVPPALQESLTHLVVAVFNCNANMFTRPDGTRFCHDTLLGFAGIASQLAVARLEFFAQDRRQLDQLITRLQELELPASVTMRCEEQPLDLSGGLTAATWKIVLEGNIEDIGKIKAAVGPVKGVVTLLPLRAVARRTVRGKLIERTIHLVVPQDTFERKKALDAVLYMQADKAGVTQVNRDLPLPELVAQIQAGLEERGEDPDGLEEIFVFHPDGTSYSLGMALVGNLPFYRPPQTGISSFAVRSGHDGITTHVHALVMAGLTHQTPAAVEEQLLDHLWMQNQLQQLIPLAGAAVTRDAGTASYEGEGAGMLPEGVESLPTELPEEFEEFQSLDLGDLDLGFGDYE